MKIILISFLLVGSVVQACVDLSGTYTCRNQSKFQSQISISNVVKGGHTLYSFLPGTASADVPDTMIADGKAHQVIVDGEVYDDTTYQAECTPTQLTTKVIWFMSPQFNNTTTVTYSFDEKKNLIQSSKILGVTADGTFETKELNVCQKK